MSLIWESYIYQPNRYIIYILHSRLASVGSITGWAPGLGVRDFAGGTVVHAYAGLAGAMAVLVLGPALRRAAKGKESEIAYKKSAEARYADLRLAIIETILLFFGWFGFNGGSTLAVSAQTGYAIINTAIASALAGFTSIVISYAERRIWDPVSAIGGIIGGLVAITPLAGFIDVPFSYLVGTAAGLVTYYGTKLVERWYAIDDPVGGLPAHGFNGIMGSMPVPVLADPDVCGMKGLIYGGSVGWAFTQWLGTAVALAFVVATTYGMFKLLTKLGLRAGTEEEVVGLDAVDHGVWRWRRTGTARGREWRAGLGQGCDPAGGAGDVIRALLSAGFTGATVINDAGGIGGEGGVMEVKGRSYEILIPRVVVEVATTADKARRVVEIISASAKTGHVGDGRIFVLPLLDSVRARTGESGVI